MEITYRLRVPDNNDKTRYFENFLNFVDKFLILRESCEPFDDMTTTFRHYVMKIVCGKQCVILGKKIFFT